MEEKPSRSSGLFIALIVILAVLLLLIFLRYSFKHDLLPARLIRSLLSGAENAAPVAAVVSPSPTPAVDENGYTADGLLAAPVTNAGYDGYLRDNLLPIYGITEESAVAAALANGYTFPGGIGKAGAIGLCSAQLIDLDHDGTSELVVLLIREDSGSYPLEMHLFGISGETVSELPGTAALLTDLAGASSAQNDCVELIGKGERSYLLYHQYVAAEGDLFVDRYIAYDITNAETTPVLDGVYSCYGKNALVLAHILPPWLDASATTGSKIATDATTGLSGNLLYADAIALNGAQYDADATFYNSSFSALDDMLGPLMSADRFMLLDPLSYDWTELNNRIGGTADGE